MENSIELRLIINPNEEIYEFLEKVKRFLITENKSHILRFILNRSSKIPFKEFINLVSIPDNKKNNNKNKNNRRGDK